METHSVNSVLRNNGKRKRKDTGIGGLSEDFRTTVLRGLFILSNFTCAFTITKLALMLPLVHKSHVGCFKVGTYSTIYCTAQVSQQCIGAI